MMSCLRFFMMLALFSPWFWTGDCCRAEPGAGGSMVAPGQTSAAMPESIDEQRRKQLADDARKELERAMASRPGYEEQRFGRFASAVLLPFAILLAVILLIRRGGFGC